MHNVDRACMGMSILGWKSQGSTLYKYGIKIIKIIIIEKNGGPHIEFICETYNTLVNWDWRKIINVQMENRWNKFHHLFILESRPLLEEDETVSALLVSALSRQYENKTTLVIERSWNVLKRLVWTMNFVTGRWMILNDGVFLTNHNLKPLSKNKDHWIDSLPWELAEEHVQKYGMQQCVVVKGLPYFLDLFGNWSW